MGQRGKRKTKQASEARPLQGLGIQAVLRTHTRNHIDCSLHGTRTQPFFGLLETDVHVPLRFFGESMLEGIARDFSYDERQAYGNGSGNKARGSGNCDAKPMPLRGSPSMSKARAVTSSAKVESKPPEIPTTALFACV